MSSGNLEDIVRYLRSLQDFAMYIAGYNKPTVLEIEGELYNSAAAIFLNIPMINCNRPTKVTFNEVLRGSTLLGGSSYTLSRLPRAVGKYLALTGTSLKEEDLWQFGLVNMDLEFDQKTIKKIEGMVRHLPAFREVSLVNKLPEFQKLRDKFGNSQFNSINVANLILGSTNMRNLEISPERAVMNILSKDLVAKHANALEDSIEGTKWEERFKSIQATGILSTIENRFGTMWKFVIEQIKKDQDKFIPQYKGEPGKVSSNILNIQRFFDESSFEEIKRNLKKDGSSWAIETLSLVSGHSSKLADVVVKQIDFASENDYVTSLVQEFHTALDYMLPHLNKSNKSAINLVDRTYNPRSPVKALLPVKDYIREYPDAVRMALNDTHNCDPFVNENFGETVRTFLNIRGIDTLNPVTNMNVVREVLWRREKAKMDIQRYNESQQMFLGSTDKQNKLFNARKTAINNYFNCPDAKHKIDKLTAAAFNKKFEDNRKIIANRAKSAHIYDRRDNIDDIKKIILDTRVAPKIRLDRQIPKFNSPIAFPLEIVNDPSAPNTELMDKYKITQRATILKRKRSFTRDKIKGYLKGSTNVYDFYDFEVRKNISQKRLVDSDYFRGFEVVFQANLDARFHRVYRDRLGITGMEDVREKAWRTDYIRRQLEAISKNTSISGLKLSEIKRNMTKTLFDYKQGSTSRFSAFDPHEAVKRVPFDSQIPVLLHKTMRTPEIRLSGDPLKELRPLLDVDFKTQDTLKFPLENLINQPRESLDFFLKQIDLDEFIHNKVSNVLDAKKLDLPFSKEQITGQKNNSRAVEFFKKTFTSYFVEEVEKLRAQLADKIQSQGTTKPNEELKNGTERENTLMGPLDSYLNRNMNYDMFEKEAPALLGMFSERIIKVVEEIFRKTKEYTTLPTAYLIDRIKGSKSKMARDVWLDERDSPYENTREYRLKYGLKDNKFNGKELTNVSNPEEADGSKPNNNEETDSRIANHAESENGGLKEDRNLVKAADNSEVDNIRQNKKKISVSKKTPATQRKVVQKSIAMIYALKEIFGISSITNEELIETAKYLDKVMIDMVTIQDYYNVSFEGNKMLIGQHHEAKVDPIAGTRSSLKKDDIRKNRLLRIVTKQTEAAKTIRPSYFLRGMLGRLRGKSSRNLPYRAHKVAVEIQMHKLAMIQPNHTMTKKVKQGLIKEYRNIKVAYMENKKELIPGPVPLIFELEALIKKMKEGSESGVDQDFSSLHNTLKKTIIDDNQSPTEWVETRVKEYFETIFLMRGKIEPHLNNQELIEYDQSIQHFFTKDNLVQMLTSELERDKAAMNIVKDIEKFRLAKESEVEKYRDRPQLMAFTLQHRIINTVAFRHYRTLFLRIQQLMVTRPLLTAPQKRYLDWEVEILKVHLERLFKESQRSVAKAETLEVSPEPGFEKRFTITNDFEDEIKGMGIQIAKSLENIDNDSVFEQDVALEVDKLQERLKIYGL